MGNSYPSICVTISRLQEIRGETRDQIEYWRDKYWIEGVQYIKMKKGSRDHYEYNVMEIDKWFLKQSAA